ncbi:MAG: hypothetical protein IPH54_17920 [Rhodoferax sp.]|nr:hypothetical protein [Rhodoferax sp.]
MADEPKCRLCTSPLEHVFDKLVLGRYQVAYHQCTGCGALQTETPHWLDEAYASKAEWYDTGKATRTVVNFGFAKTVRNSGVRKSDLAVDFGGGTSLLARLLRDVGYNFHTCDKFGSSEFAGAYAWPDMGHPCRLVTLFEVAEHLPTPRLNGSVCLTVILTGFLAAPACTAGRAKTGPI